MKIIPVNFNKEAQSYARSLQDDIRDMSVEKLLLNPNKFDKLITALRTAVDNDDVLDKEATSYNDIFDAFRLALRFYHFQERTD